MLVFVERLWYYPCTRFLKHTVMNCWWKNQQLLEDGSPAVILWWGIEWNCFRCANQRIRVLFPFRLSQQCTFHDSNVTRFSIFDIVYLTFTNILLASTWNKIDLPENEKVFVNISPPYSYERLVLLAFTTHPSIRRRKLGTECSIASPAFSSSKDLTLQTKAS